MERVRTFFAWLGAAALAVGSFLLAVVLLRRKHAPVLEMPAVQAAAAAIDQKATAAHAQVDADAQSKTDEVEAQHAQAVRKLEADNAQRAAALRDSRAALAKALQRHARSEAGSDQSSGDKPST